jgi:hypothetical protein
MLIHAADSNANTLAAVICPPKTWSPVIVAGALRRLVNELFDHYRPELYYMRGPGPRWRERHKKSLSTTTPN